jgi:hypothetical protein
MMTIELAMGRATSSIGKVFAWGAWREGVDRFFQEAGRASSQKKERELMATAQKDTLPVVKASKTGYSMLKPKQSTAHLILQIMHEKGLRTHDEVLRLLADTFRLYEQMEALLVQEGKEGETTTALSALKALVSVSLAQPVPASVEAHLRERCWALVLEEIDTLFSQARDQGEGQTGCLSARAA